MKNWIKGLLFGSIFSMLIFVYFLNIAVNIELDNAKKERAGNQKYCDILEICNTCNSDTECMKNKYKELFPKDYDYFEKGIAMLNLDAGIFFRDSFCIKHNENIDCLIAQKPLNKVDFIFKKRTMQISLLQITKPVYPYGFFISTPNIYKLFAYFILIVPILLGIFIGYLFDIRRKAKNMI